MTTEIDERFDMLLQALGEFSAICMKDNPQWVFPSNEAINIAKKYYPKIIKEDAKECLRICECEYTREVDADGNQVVVQCDYHKEMGEYYIRGYHEGAQAERERVLAALLDEYEMRKLAEQVQDIFNRKISNPWDEFFAIQAVLNPWLRQRIRGK